MRLGRRKEESRLLRLLGAVDLHHALCLKHDILCRDARYIAAERTLRLFFVEPPFDPFLHERACYALTCLNAAHVRARLDDFAATIGQDLKWDPSFGA